MKGGQRTSLRPAAQGEVGLGQGSREGKEEVGRRGAQEAWRQAVGVANWRGRCPENEGQSWRQGPLTQDLEEELIGGDIEARMETGGCGRPGESPGGRIQEASGLRSKESSGLKPRGETGAVDVGETGLGAGRSEERGSGPLLGMPDFREWIGGEEAGKHHQKSRDR